MRPQRRSTCIVRLLPRPLPPGRMPQLSSLAVAVAVAVVVVVVNGSGRGRGSGIGAW